MRKRDCTNCGWGVEWELVFNSRGEATLRGRCRFQPMPKLCDCLRTTIGPKAKPATDCPAWKKASGPVPPWGVWTVSPPIRGYDGRWYVAVTTARKGIEFVSVSSIIRSKHNGHTE